MKYVIFAIAMGVGVPLAAAAASISGRVRSLLLSATVFATALGDFANINFLSHELYRGPERGLEVNLADLAAWALGASLVVRRARGMRWVPYNTFFMLALLGVSVFSALSAPIPLYGGFTVFKLVRVFVIYWVVFNAVRTGVPVHAIRRGLVAVAAMAVLLALKQKYVDGTYRVPLLFDHPNTAAMYLNMVAPVLLAFGLADRGLSRRQAVVTLVAALGAVFTVVETFSRAGMALAAGTTLAVVAIANLRMTSLRVTATTVVVMAGLAFGGALTAQSIITRFDEAPQSSQDARVEFNQVADAMAADHPFGIGLNNFSHVLTNTPEYRSMLVVTSHETQAGVVHEMYRLTLAEVGWPGLLLFIAVLARFAWRAFRSAWLGRGLAAMVQAGVLLGLLALHASGLFEWAFRQTPVSSLFGVLCGLSVGLASSRAHLRLPLPGPAIPARPLTRVAAA